MNLASLILESLLYVVGWLFRLAIILMLYLGLVVSIIFLALGLSMIHDLTLKPTLYSFIGLFGTISCITILRYKMEPAFMKYILNHNGSNETIQT